MKRRTFLAGIGAASTVALAGCLGDDNDREELVEDYLEAVDDGDMELADSLVHEDGEIPFEGPESVSVDEVEERDREDAADGTGHDLSELEEEDESLTDLQGFEDTAYVYGDIETESDGDIEVYYHLVQEDDGLWYIWRDL